jgi:hypothetical protein
MILLDEKEKDWRKKKQQICKEYIRAGQSFMKEMNEKYAAMKKKENG